MRVLVTGSEGQLAREVRRLLALRGDVVEGHDRDVLDISDFFAVSKMTSEVMPDYIINCAAYNDVDGAETRWEDAFLVNGIGVKNLAIAARKHGAVLVHFSSDYVFDGEAHRSYTIADVPSPLNMYGQSKLLGEELLKDHGERYFLIRTSWVFGRGAFSFPLKILEWASKNRTLRVVDDQVASPTYASDLAEAALKLMATKNYGLYHITNSGFCSRFEWAEFILANIGWKGELLRAGSDEFSTPARRPAYSVLDNFPLSQTIGGLLPSWQDATGRFLKEAGAL